MERDAAGLRGERHRQQPALERRAGPDVSLRYLEVLLRLLLGPRLRAGRERLQAERGAGRVADVAARVAGALLEQQRLDLALEDAEIELGRGLDRREEKEQQANGCVA